FFFSSRRRHTRSKRDWSSDVCSSDLDVGEAFAAAKGMAIPTELQRYLKNDSRDLVGEFRALAPPHPPVSIQRWSARRVGLTLMVVVGSAVLAAWSFTIFFTVAD